MTKQTKKPLLEEGVTRRMMGLAGIGRLSEQFVSEKFKTDEELKETDTPTTQTREGKRPSESPIKQGPNKTMEGLQTQDEALSEGFPGEEQPGSTDAPPEAPVAPGPEEPDGDEGAGMGEPMVADLVKAIADAITAQTGVAVDVEGASSGGEGEEMPPQEPEGDEMPPEAGTMPKPEDEQMMETGSKRTPESTPPDRKPDMARESLKEEFSEAPKVTKQGDQGKQKDPTKGQVRVQGVEKPEAYLGKSGDGYPHKMKALEEQLVKRVLNRLLEEVKKTKAKKTVKK